MSRKRGSDELAALMATAPSPAAAGYHAARVLLAHADQFRLADTSDGRAGLEAMRELTEPQKVILLYRNGRLTSAHATEEAARTQANRQGAAPDGWGHHSKSASWGEFASIIRSPWCIATVPVDAAAPWTTPREPLASVYIVIKEGLPYGAFSSPDDAIREQDRLGIPRTADSLIRMEPATDDTTAAA